MTKLKRIHVSFDHEAHKAILTYAKKLGITKSVAVQRLVILGLLTRKQH